MCEMNFIADKAVTGRDWELMGRMVRGSVERGNYDGCGILTNTVLVKRLDEEVKVERIGEGGERFILNHCRWASAGDISMENVQPIRCGDVVVAHHGHLNGLVYHESHSDSYKLAIAMRGEYERSGSVYKAIRVLDGQRFFSCFVYFVDRGRLFYVRDKSARFFFTKWGEKLVGTTVLWNLWMMGVKRAFLPGPHVIYELRHGKIVKTGRKVREG